ncbi:type IX secretion system outer membrane channel protein PorV [Zhouia spongiae]|uniref:Type IX secretion system outer membrane channel protein PorV n=1 Tax=Zhouia spongiae TaxID=2202721 RepID=A0ABY3YS60_9FLAO|nr:type IX secretion system outer membrane channel protein PorV [Zhouia spongiae]UNZ00297.1 type IX secretion system outer membrane channel protein PorV [Zhouia spongiae]
MKKILGLFAICSVVYIGHSQEGYQEITTGVPFLLISADARASGMGDLGVATSPNAFSQQWNPSKYSFSEREVGIGVSYTPYLRELATDISLMNVTYYNRYSERSAYAFSLKYFGLGEILFRQGINDEPIPAEPNEFALDGSYTLKLSEQFSMGVTGRYIRSNLKLQQIDANSRSANSFAVDVSGYYQSEEKVYNDFNGRWRAGFNLSNLGPKIQYDEGGQESFLPANLKVGAGFDFIMDQDNTIALSSEFNKLLVPTPKDFDGDGDIDNTDNDLYNNIDFFEGVFKSFNDAPDGFSEELSEITWALGGEYNYRDVFAFRSGYYHESKKKGVRRYFTLGAGFKFNNTTIDVSYLFSTSNVANPLENTLRFGLTFNLGETYYQY